jgi:amino acid permease
LRGAHAPIGFGHARNWIQDPADVVYLSVQTDANADFFSATQTLPLASRRRRRRLTNRRIISHCIANTQSYNMIRMGSLSFLLLCCLAWTPTNNAWSFRSSSSKALQQLKVQPHQQQQQAFKTPSSSSKSAAAASDSVARGGFVGDDETEPLTKATIPNEVFNLIKSIVGAGVLSLPAGVAAFANAPSALIPATLLIVLMGSISAYTFALIGRVCRESNTTSYSDAWNVVVGQRWAPLIAFSCFVDCFAGNLSYSMILADTLKLLLAGVGYSVTRTQSLLGVTGLVLLPLCLLKNLNSLAPFSLVGIMGMVYTIGAMAFRYFGGDYVVGSGQFVTEPAASTLMALPSFGTEGASALWGGPKALVLLCMLSNAYIAHFSAPKFLNELENPTLPRFYQVISWSFGAAIVLFATLTALGFATFGAASNGLILNNYASTDAWMSLSRIAVAISITCRYDDL